MLYIYIDVYNMFDYNFGISGGIQLVGLFYGCRILDGGSSTTVGQVRKMKHAARERLGKYIIYLDFEIVIAEATHKIMANILSLCKMNSKKLWLFIRIFMQKVDLKLIALYSGFCVSYKNIPL